MVKWLISVSLNGVFALKMLHDPEKFYNVVKKEKSNWKKPHELIYNTNLVLSPMKLSMGLWLETSIGLSILQNRFQLLSRNTLSPVNPGRAPQDLGPDAVTTVIQWLPVCRGVALTSPGSFW